MAKEWAKHFYNSKNWISCRRLYIASRIKADGGMCEHCSNRLGYIVDHIEELNEQNIDDPEITLGFNNLQYLCLVCHNKKTFKKNSPVRFDESGAPLPPIH